MSEAAEGLRKRTLGEAEDAEDLITHKSLRTDDSETESSDSSDTSTTSSGSSSSSSSTASDEDFTSNVVSSADLEIPVGFVTDTQQLHAQVDAWKWSKLRNRHWVHRDSARMFHSNSGSDGSHKNGFKFTIASYNVLAQNLLEENSYLYSHCGDCHYLEWSYRQHQLLDEITHYEPDILCCQEIQEEHYREFFCPEMEKLGYQGFFKKRTRMMRDGCATFYKKSSFECEVVEPVEYLVPGVASLDRDNVALLLLLQPKNELPSAEQTQLAKLCVANTHLLFNPRRGDVKLAQLMKLFAEIDRLTYRPCPAGPHHRNHHPVLICGDMNLEPFSYLYKFVRGGKLVLDGQPVAKLSGQERRWTCGQKWLMTAGFLGKHAGLTDQSQYVSVCQQRCNNKVPSQTDDDVSFSSVTEPDGTIFTQGSGTVSHKFGLDSVYPHYVMLDDGGGQNRGRLAREVTTCHTRANCTVDYIFYTSSRSGVSHSENDFGPNSAAETTRCASDDEQSASDTVPVSTSNDESLLNVRTESSASNAALDVADYSLTLLARLKLLSDKEMKKIGQLPNKFISSDHLILVAQFLLTNG